MTNEDLKLKEKTAHESQTDAKKGFGGKFGVQSDRVDKSAVGFEYHEKLSSHASQKGLFSYPFLNIFCFNSFIIRSFDRFWG